MCYFYLDSDSDNERDKKVTKKESLDPRLEEEVILMLSMAIQSVYQTGKKIIVTQNVILGKK